MSDDRARMRWDPYVLSQGAEVDVFWRRHLSQRERRVLLVMGRGFDVRALETAKGLVGVGADLRVWLLAFDNGLDDSPARAALTEANYDQLVGLLPRDAIQEMPIEIGGPATSTMTSRNTQSTLREAGDLAEFDDIVVDISAMPRMVALTIIAVLLRRLDILAAAEGGRSVNLHVQVAESVSADLGAAKGTLREAVTQVVGFSGQLTAQTTENWPRIWFPVLGENQKERLDLIQTFIDPDEICPVVPFPSRSPRRGDEIVDEHRAILFDDFHVEPANILLACEYNPFEAYKQIFVAMDRYRRALRPLQGCKAFVSPISSKLLSIAVLLACYDHRFGDVPGQRLDVGIPYVETAVYGDPSQPSSPDHELFSLWIRGDWEV